VSKQTSQPDTGSVPRRVIAILVVVFLALHVVPVLAPGLDLWGVDFLAYLPAAATALFIAGGLFALLMVLHAPTSRALRNLALRIDPWSPGRTALAWRLGILAAFITVLVVLRSRVHFLGDGYLYLQNLSRSGPGSPQHFGHEPLVLWLMNQVYALVKGFGLTPELLYRVFSILSGLLYAVISLRLARDLGRDLRERILVLTLLLTPGYLQLFAGYVESYAMIVPVLLAYCHLGLQALKRPRLVWVTASVLGLAVGLHFMTVTFAPSLLILLLLIRRRSSGTSLAASFGPLLAAAVIATGLVLAIGFRPLEYQQTLRSSHLLPLFSELNMFQAYRLFSLHHLADLGNLSLLVASGSVMLLPLLLYRPGWREPQNLFLIGAVTGAGVAVIFLNPEIGAFRDWDLLSIPAVPLIVLTARQAIILWRQRPGLWRPVAAVVLATALHTGTWMLVNADTAAATARYRDSLQRTRLSQHAQEYGWETLGAYHIYQDRDHRAAAAAYDAAIAAGGHNPRYWNLAGVQYAALGELPKAIRYLERSVELQIDDDPRHLNNLAGLYSQVGEPDRAIAALERAVAAKPDYALGYHNLGLTYAQLGRHAEAVRSLRRAAELRPRDPKIREDLRSAEKRLDASPGG